MTANTTAVLQDIDLAKKNGIEYFRQQADVCGQIVTCGIRKIIVETLS